MSEKIEVGYRHIGTVAGVEYHHKFLLYTDKKGQQYTISGWTDDANQNPDLPFGNIRILAGAVYDANNPDSYARHPNQKQYRELIAEAPDLSAKWTEMVKNAQSKDNIYPYDYLRQNSNTLADAVLREAGFPEPKKDGITKHLAPGSGNKMDRTLIPKNPGKPGVSDVIDAISLEENTLEKNTLQTAAKEQSKYDEVHVMIQGLLNDKDGSFAKKLLADNQDIVDAFDAKVQASIEQDKQRQMQTAQQMQEVERETVTRSFGRSFG